MPSKPNARAPSHPKLFFTELIQNAGVRTNKLRSPIVSTKNG